MSLVQDERPPELGPRPLLPSDCRHASGSSQTQQNCLSEPRPIADPLTVKLINICSKSLRLGVVCYVQSEPPLSPTHHAKYLER